jgi:hypothetical protein
MAIRTGNPREWPHLFSALRQQLFHYHSVNIGQPEVAALKTERQFLVIEAEQMQQRCVQVMHVNTILDHIEAEFIRCAERDARFHAATCDPHRERFVVVIAA